MTRFERIVGGAGTGKTQSLLERMDVALQRYRDPAKIGFITFTRSGADVAAHRAASRYHVGITELKRTGWFRTIHSAVHRLLQVGDGELLIEDQKKGREEIEKAIGEKMTMSKGDDRESFAQASPAGKVLMAWGACRNRLEPICVAWRRLQESTRDLPGEGYAERVVEAYEAFKRREGRSDFTDLLLRFAGKRVGVRDVTECRKEGLPPDLPVWFADEWQDCTALQAATFLRLSQNAELGVLCGDAFQSIYGFGGADPKIFLNWKVEAERTLPKSWRCSRQVWDFGENIMRRTVEYSDRGIESAGHDGAVMLGNCDHLRELNPASEWLVLARTNWLAGGLASELTKGSIPFSWIGREAAADSKNIRAVLALRKLAAGGRIDADEWEAVTTITPSTAVRDGRSEPVLIRGAKTAAAKEFPGRPGVRYSAEDLEALGATPAFIAGIGSGDWKWAIGEVQRGLAKKIEKHGEELCRRPKIKVGTFHASKGMEADNVFMTDETTGVCERGSRSPESYAEESRAWYVAATRARNRVVIARPRKRKSLEFGTPACAAALRSFSPGVHEVVQPRETQRI